MKNILLVTEIFPPFPGIGGRRWAKFVKHFSKLNLNVDVVSAIYNEHSAKKSIWTSDVRGLKNFSHHQIPLHYPAVLNDVPVTIFHKIKYRVALQFVKLFSKGNYYDRTMFWQTNYQNLVEKIIIEKSIDTIIATVAPLNLAFQLIPLKAKYPQIKFIVDFRDPWALGNLFGFPFKKKRQFHEIEKEKAVCNSFDLVTFPNYEMKEKCKLSYGLPNNKLYILEHAFDEDDFPNFEIANRNENNEIVFLGTIYDGLQEHFQQILNVLQSFPAIKLKLYASNKNANKFHFSLPPNASFQNELPPRVLFATISQSKFILIAYTPKQKDLIATKFYEIIALRIPILYIGFDGIVADFIIQNKLGIYIHSNDISSALPNVLSGKVKCDYNFNFDVSKFSFQFISKKFIEKVESITENVN